MNENILIAMNYIDENLVANAVKARKKPKPVSFGKAAAAAAVFVAVAAAVLTFINAEKKPLLSLGIEQSDGMGFESWFFTDISQAENGNPWSAKNTPKTLPVYESIPYDENGYPCAIDEATQRKRLNDAASVLGLEIMQDITCSESENGGAISVSAETSGGSITVNAAGTVTAVYSTPAEFPKNFEENYVQSSYADLCRHFFGANELHLAVSESCNVYGEITMKYRIYYGKTAKEKIISYNLRHVEIIAEPSGVTTVFINDELISESKIADYPIISQSKAKELLLGGSRITSQVQYEFPGEEYVAKAELVYRHGRGETIAPYYLFYVELPEAPDENGLKSYGAYYVPAVEQKYISDFPLYDGEFQ